MSEPRYTIIDLGSNSFHMLTVTRSDDGFSVFNKSKQKVRLASGLDKQSNLNQQTMQTGWDCLSQFRHELNELQPIDLIVTATAALRLAQNKYTFLDKAQSILQHPINLISGIEEAQTIYQGVVFTEQTKAPLLVIDIGGASTELIIGEGSLIHFAESLNMGCVTWLNQFFADKKLNAHNFQQAINAAKIIIHPFEKAIKKAPWSLTMGASGTIQAVNEINAEQSLKQVISIDLLKQIMEQCIACESIDKLEIAGLKASRVAVFASGLCILIALFESLSIKELSPSRGALREGLISLLFARN